MRYKFIILSVFWAMLGCVPAFAADDTPESATDTAVEQTSSVDVLIEDEDPDYYDVQDVVNESDWCPEDGTTPISERKAELCKLLKEIETLKQAYVQEAEENYAAAKENEQSLENRTLSSVTMAATGIGGMELAQGLSEQKSDKAAEDEMNAYLSTFQCKVGTSGKSYKGGETAIETPGANQLIKLYQEYVDLAASLKSRKNVLGMKPGLEAEVVLDKAHTGLYDDVGHGIENGTFASLYRASKGNENDIKKLEDAKAASKKRVIGGAVAASAGVVAGIVGNAIINKGKGKKNQELREKQAQLKSRFDEISQQFIQECNNLIQEHKDFVKTLPAEKLELEDIAAYKQAVDAAKPITDIKEIKDSKFCR